MALIHRLLFHAAQRLVTDPRVREKAAELIETEVKPRVRDTWQQVKPRIDATKSDLAQIASENRPAGEAKGVRGPGQTAVVPAQAERLERCAVYPIHGIALRLDRSLNRILLVHEHHRAHGFWMRIEHSHRLSASCRASPDSVVVTSAGMECK